METSETARGGPAHAPAVRYLRDCHEADSRSFGVFDVLATRGGRWRILDGAERLLTDTLPRLPMTGEWVEQTRKLAAVYRREKSLVYGTFIVVGELARPGTKAKRLCAPLLLFAARLVEAPLPGGDPMIWVEVDLDRPRINVPVLAALLGTELDGALARFPEAPFDVLSSSEVAELLHDARPDLDVAGLTEFPDLLAGAALRRAVRAASKAGHICAVSASVVGLMDNPAGTRGVHHELGLVAAAAETSAPLRALLCGEQPTPQLREGKRAVSGVPALLSGPQQAVLEHAACSPVSVVIGPPGTGKSFTMAALALDHVCRGESVLLATRTPQALDVLAEKAEGMLGEAGAFVVRGGRGGHSKRLRDLVARLLRGGVPRDVPKWTEDDAQALRTSQRELHELEEELRDRVPLEKRWARTEDGFVGAVQRAWLQWRIGKEPHWAVADEYVELLDRSVELLSRRVGALLWDRVRGALKTRRAEVATFLDALRARTSSRQEERFRALDLAALLEAFPLWMVPLADLHRVLPLQAELFDAALVDEATQVDMATGLLALHRARRAVVCGDPQQLRHVSFLSRSRQGLIADEHGVADDAPYREYRDHSLLDLADQWASRQGHVATLDEHYRSRPRIIGFSNREFYAGSLRIMTRHPRWVGGRAVELRHVGGARAPEGHNAAEAEALLAEVARRIADEAGLDAGHHSIGILSPFRDQVDHLTELAGQRLSLEALRKHDVLIATAYGFQGEERDEMLLSLVVGADAHPATLRYLCRPDVFNVAVTRARARQVVFASLRPDQAPAGSLLARYLAEAATGGTTLPEAPERAPDPFAAEVAEALMARGFGVHVGWRVAGLAVDLVADRGGHALGIDLIGHAGEVGEAFGLERYRMLHRAGLSILPLPWSWWQRRREEALDAIERRWAQG